MNPMTGTTDYDIWVKTDKDLAGRESFDKAQVDIQALKVDEVTAARVERQIQAVKAARKS